MIQVEHLTKWYGQTHAVKDLSFEIGDTGVYGFLGPNGAGKSTTLNMLTGCLSPTEGKITIGNQVSSDCLVLGVWCVDIFAIIES